MRPSATKSGRDFRRVDSRRGWRVGGSFQLAFSNQGLAVFEDHHPLRETDRAEPARTPQGQATFALQKTSVVAQVTRFLAADATLSRAA